MRYPDFLVVGAAKSGTTALYHMLKQHPDLFLPAIKETWFFSLYNNPNRSILNRFPYLPQTVSEYTSLFSKAEPGQQCGEVTPSYLYYYDHTIAGIQKTIPEWEKLKIIIILREPVEKILSHYHFVNYRLIDPEMLSLTEALEKETERLTRTDLLPDVLYVDNTRYSQQVKAFLDNFQNVKIFLYDQLRDDPRTVLSEICLFLGVSDVVDLQGKNKRYNTSSSRIWPRWDLFKRPMMRYHYLNKYLPVPIRRWMDFILYEENRIDEATVRKLKTIFKDEVEQLQSLINLDLNHWLEKYQ